MLRPVARAVLVASLAVTSVASTVAMAQETKVPQVGKPVFTKETYKPVVGTYGGRIVRNVIGEPKSFNPITAGETSTTDYTNRIFEGLTSIDPFTGEYIPQLAESWSVAEDKVTWTFKLRAGVTFNDGSALTAKDVEFTYNELIYDNKRAADVKAPRWPCSARDSMQVDGKPIEVKAIDDLTIQVRTAAPTALLVSWMSYGIVPEKIYGASARDGTFGGKMGADAKPEEIVGAGAWVLGVYQRGNQVVLKRNSKYWRKDAAGNQLPYLEEQVFRPAGNLNIMLLNFQKGETDVYSLSSGREVPILKPKQEAENFVLWQLGPSYGTEFVAFNMNLKAAEAGKIPKYKVEWFRDKRFRMAVAHAVDRQSMIRNVLRQLGHPLPGPYTVAPGPMLQTGMKGPEYNVEKAKALLAEMGFKPGADGVLEKDGQQLSFSLTTNAGNTTREGFADIVRKDLVAVGMKVNFLPLEFNLLVDKLDNTQDWEAMLMGFTGTLEPNDGANFWRSSGRSHLWFPKQETPSTAWEKRIDEIFDVGVKELDSAKRKTIYKEWVELSIAEQPVIYTVTGERVAAVRSRFGNLFPSSAATNPVFHNEEFIFELKK